MAVKILTNAQHLVSKWSGGITTQLFIYPENADYQKRNFLFRLSTATVDVDCSDFTSLPGFKRKLMILKGELAIRHKGHFDKTLKKFEQDEFDGGWETTAEGKVVDFNLMMAPGAEGSLEHMSMEKGQKTPLEMSRFSFIYLHEGWLMVDGCDISTGDLVIVEDPKEIILIAKERCEIVLCSVNGELKGPAF